MEGDLEVGGEKGRAGECACCPSAVHVKRHSSSGLLDVLQVWMDGGSGSTRHVNRFQSMSDGRMSSRSRTRSQTRCRA